MKKSILLMSVFAIALLIACGTAVQPEQVTVTPGTLVVVGNKVDANITGTFPVRKFSKNAVMTITPVLVYEGGEAVGKSVTYVGENAKENGTVVSYSEGAKFSMKASFDYVPEMAKSKLVLRYKATVSGREVEIPEMKIADGVVGTAKLALAMDVKPQITPDKFQRIIQEVQEADIRFLVQQSTLRSSELNSQDMKDLQTAIKDADKDANKAINKIEVLGYASPEGGQKLNEKLANDRQSKSQSYLEQQLKKAKVSANISSDVTPEDWEGFQKALEASNIQDKDLVLRVLSMYTDPEERETQIKNLSTVFKAIAEEILPELRRSRLVLTTDLIGKTDEEIKSLVKSDPAALNVEELLYSATLFNCNNEKFDIYKKVVELYPNDYRGYNNLGITYFAQGKVDDARQCYAKALQMQPNNPDVNYNSAIAAMAIGDLSKAEEYLGKAAGTEGNLSAAMGTFYTMKGDYSAAKNAYGTTVSNNAAVQKVLNEDYAGARQTLAKVENPNAITAYVAAVVGARTNDREAVYSNLALAVQRDPQLKARAKKDLEFAKFVEDEKFQEIIK
jgi:Flp pilus assembly protein TadD